MSLTVSYPKRSPEGWRKGAPSLMKASSFLVLLSLFVFSFPRSGGSTPEYAAQTGRACAACHIDPAGGGSLTAQGAAILEELKTRGDYRPLSPVRHVVRLFVGYLHMLTAILWFGTILYVHLLLKPAYAAQGLPRGELWLGWASMGVLAVTGTLLAVTRIATWHLLFHSRFGILLVIKVSLFLVMVTMATVVTFILGPRLRKRKAFAAKPERRDMTSEEVAFFDGRDGRSALIVYRGRIYDVTASRLWQEGGHMSKHRAGSDLTAYLKQAPHEEDRVLSMPLVGQLVEAGGQEGRRRTVKTFYVLAYLNLALVFVIVFVISLWRWW